jgi:hypothetical protein
LGTFAVPSPGAVAFDGANIWVGGVNTVSELRASDGVLLGTFTVGQQPAAMIFDGANLWLANVNDTLSKL